MSAIVVRPLPLLTIAKRPFFAWDTDLLAMKRSLLDATFAVAGLSGFLVAGTAATEGLSTAQRVMTDLVMPVGLFWLITLAAAVYQFRIGNRRAGYAFATAFLAIWVLFSSSVSATLNLMLEYPLPEQSPLAAEATDFQAVIVLGGGASRNHAGHAELGGAGERLVMAAKLWHAGKTERIICTGTQYPQNPPFFDRGDQACQSGRFNPGDPADVGLDILVALSVPAERIYLSAGQNTVAEMQHLAALLPELLQDVDDQRPIGLITSGFHMRRAIRLSLSQGLQLTPIVAGSSAGGVNIRGIGVLVPTAGAGDNLSRVAKEWLARLIGR
jgi:uncharacterized SAM-binding protein YcdF (DUF218 family)